MKKILKANLLKQKTSDNYNKNKRIIIKKNRENGTVEQKAHKKQAGLEHKKNRLPSKVHDVFTYIYTWVCIKLKLKSHKNIFLLNQYSVSK